MRVRSLVLVAIATLAAAPACGRREGPVGVVQPPPEAPPPLATTGAAQALSRVTSDPITEEWTSLSPDGKTLLFHAVEVDPASGHQRFLVVGVDPNTGARRTLYTSPQSSSGYPSWLPNGTTYIYMTDSMGTQSIVRALSSAPNAGVSVAVSGQVAPEPIQPHVSPDGTRVAFRTFMNGEHQVALSGMDGSNLTILGPGNAPRWHPNGKLLVFSRNVGGYDQLFTIDVDTGAHLTQLTNEQANSRWPCWSPDGRHIAFTSDRTGKLDLYALRPDGTVLTALTQGTADATTPTWGTDGYVYFSSNAAGGWDIWRFRPIGELEATAAITPDPPSVAPPGPGQGPAGGCSKDTDCKGDRICVQGACVDPKNSM
jgi:TolB protein